MKFKKTADESRKTPIKSLLNSVIGGHEPYRSKKIIHASDLTRPEVEYCPREVRLMEVLNVKPKDPWVPTPLRVTFDDGRDKQDRMTNVYLRGHIVGDWKCASCGEFKKWTKVPNADCVGKAKCNWQYVESRFQDPVSKATCGVDALVDIGALKLRAVEFKIMADSLFPPKAPLAEHRLRTALYLKLIAESEHPHKDEIDTQKASVVYMHRGHGKKDENGEISPFREFEVKRDDELVSEEIAKATVVTKSRVTGDMPFGVCEHAMCPRAKMCPVAKQCFGGGYPPLLVWGKVK